ncbi:YtxC-like family protein [Halobacteroides halobius DSM 5150]|uniref:YtxC-like family protein n=1 Tax=Halobacteroides halobius (strain ATCC 35273 / DSM 5150 / MD-1) TaxID=748449 RepID=L0KD25_HALHC|nr:putative sporulation protein YtxC [Halobacteroides halobius]AGB41983.1 YtxC-like family protein [Halobacteroides halobius DSM 5150]
MTLVRIGSNNYINNLEERLYFELGFLREDGIEIEINRIVENNIVFFECKYKEEEQFSIDIFREYIANALSDIIINYFESDLLDKILKNNYNYFSTEEKEIILEMAYDRLNFLVSQDNEEIISKIQRKNKVLLEIIDYLKSEDEFILEGFIRFRLKDYLAELKLAIEGAVEDYMVERENQEFIYLLKSFIDNQTTKNELVNVIKTKNGNFQLLDSNGIVLENIFLDEYILQMVDDKLHDEDLLISALISIAPKEIIIHFDKPISIIKTLKKIFTDRISICLGCNYCELNDLNELE